MAKTPAKDEFLVGRDHLVQLILQHLHYEGLHEARKVLEEEAGVKCMLCVVLWEGTGSRREGDGVEDSYT